VIFASDLVPAVRAALEAPERLPLGLPTGPGDGRLQGHLFPIIN
jgi:hypothetical protein